MIKYICDICGQEVYEIEIIGPGVVQNYPDNPYMGKEYHFVGHVEEQEVEVYVALRSTGKDHFCKACMWTLLEQMIDKYGPQTVDVDMSHRILGCGSIEELRQVLADEETHPGATGPDTELSELYAEGVLQETSPDEPADDPGTARGSLLNLDDIQAPPGAGYRTKEQQQALLRPGWQYRSTANGI